jgi:hypothetical protein
VLTLVIGAPRVLLTEPAGSLYGAMPRVFLQYTTPFPEPAARAALTLYSRVPSVSTTRAFGRLCLHPRQVSQEQACHVRPIHTAACPREKVCAEVKSRHLGPRTWL